MGPALSRHCEEPFCGDEAMTEGMCVNGILLPL
jgi:hypothetical protein